ncbi:flagellar M-ring protein FliF [Novosphingobium profundi]|uniref:flagellar basal-body MS-ring/collar protein FliF n=1 Tax=Novosphingobium profundi TaxID=1774954 RepID=UPI001BD9CE2C|nr:flagellar M-ring protein FliF [Novosphingobium profundi]
MGGIAVALLAGLGWLAFRTPEPSMGYLYTDLDPTAAQSITEKLSGQGVPFQLSADGSAIMAPVDRLAELRMSLASEQLGGKIGYEVLDEEEPFGVSSSRARLNETRAVEGELAKSIESIDRISRARVHVVMPERALFETERRKASAAITVKTTGRIPAETVDAIRYLVSSAVPDLAPEAVSIVDQNGALLARSGDEGAGSMGDLDERKGQIEDRLRGEIEAMIEPIVGRGKVRAQVAADLNRDQTRKESEVFDPDTQVIAHQVTVESNDQNDENSAAAQGVTVGAQLPDAQGNANGNGGDRRRSAKNETSEDTTYQNSRTTTVSVGSPGEISRLTVAVMVDGGKNGLPQGEMQRLQRLVENAVGFNAERGDSVVVENMAFTAPTDFDDAQGGLPFGITPERIFDILKILLVGGIVLFGLRMLKPKLFDTPVLEGIVEENPALPLDAETIELTGRAADGDEEAMRELEERRSASGEHRLDQDIAIAQVDGHIKLSALRRIGDAVVKNPAESTSVIRQWMNG